MLNSVNDSFEGKTVIVSGSGNVAIYANEKATELGAKVIAMSDSSGFIYDPNGINNPPTRTDVKICKIDAINVAAKVGNAKVYNMAVMGAFLKMKPIIMSENIDKGLAKCIPARYADLISLNKAAIEEGMNAVEEL